MKNAPVDTISGRVFFSGHALVVPNPFARRSAFDLGRSENEFRWSVVNAVVGGVTGSASVAALDRVGVALEAVAAGWVPTVRRDLDEVRGDWRDYLAMEGDWRQAYADALDVNTAECFPGWSPADRVLAHLWSFVARFRDDLERLVQVALLPAGDAVKAAHSLGLLLDQGVRPPVTLADTEVAAELGYDAPGRPPRLPTLRDFIREVPNPDQAAWRKRRTGWTKRHGTDRPFEEPEPPATVLAPSPRTSGELPPTASWSGTVRVLWEKVGLDDYRHLPDDLETLPDAAPSSRVARVGYVVELAHEAFTEMRSAPRAGGRATPPGPEELRGMVEREWGAKLTGCTASEGLAFLQYQAAAAALASSPGGGTGGRGPTDRAAYDWVKASGGGGEVWNLPAEFETWSRYLRAARKKVGELKNRPRRGREGRSIVRRAGDGPADPGGNDS